ncbi:MAG: FAD:protein FMN transferase [Myxococcota bacterium]|nr:FAD:protein FMN transferase [Myxococcota bacterium]
MAKLPELVHRSRKVMGSQITLTVIKDESPKLDLLVEEVFREFSRLEALLSVWKLGSDVVKINKAAGMESVRVSEETINILKIAEKVSQRTGGKFDVSFGALSGLWRFDHDQDNKIPDPKLVKERLSLVDYESISINEKERTVKLEKKGMRIHLGGIGKGYAVDRAVSILKNNGVKNFMMQAGGDLYVAGSRGPRAWRVGVRDPRGLPSDYFAATEVTDATFSTSGDYERYFVKDGVRYHHIIDPDSGEPARKCRSVTVMAPNAITADTLSTAVFLVGAEEGLKIINETPGAAAIIVDSDNKVHISRRLENKVKLLHPPSN